MFDAALVRPTAADVAAPRPGDDIVPAADVVMDRAFTVAARPEAVWPWLVQLGKGRAGWYFPRSIEHLVPRSRRGARSIDPRWQVLAVGDRIPDYGPKGYFDVVHIDPPEALVYFSRRGRNEFTWSMTLEAAGRDRTRVFLRLRIAAVRHQTLARSVGGLFDLLTIAGMAAGLRERLAESAG